MADKVFSQVAKIDSNFAKINYETTKHNSRNNSQKRRFTISPKNTDTAPTTKLR